MKHTIFYFTGTGNSLNIAQIIANKQDGSSLVSIASNIKHVDRLKPEGSVGFVFPVYYCGLPQIVHEFISKLSLEHAAYLYMVAAYGATGGNGGCISQMKRLFATKGKTIHAGFYIKSVDNFILWTWDVPVKAKQPQILNEAHRKAEQIAQLIHDQKNHIDTSIVEYIGPVLFRHQHFEKTVKRADKAFYSTQACTSCGLCADVCPTNNINISTGKPKWIGESCQRCLACLHFCPVEAIQYGKVTLKRHRYRNPYTVKEIIKKK